MRLATTLENETLDQLVARVYELPSERKEPTLRAARKALTDANLYLSAIGSVPPGTVILVPEVKGASVAAGATSEPGALIGEVAVAQLRGAIALAAQQLGDDLTSEVEDARATAKLAQSAEVRREAKEQAAAALDGGSGGPATSPASSAAPAPAEAGVRADREGLGGDGGGVRVGRGGSKRTGRRGGLGSKPGWTFAGFVEA